MLSLMETGRKQETRGTMRSLTRRDQCLSHKVTWRWSPWLLWVQGQGRMVHKLPLLVLIQSVVKQARPGVSGRYFLETCFAREKVGPTVKWSVKNDEKMSSCRSWDLDVVTVLGSRHRENRAVELMSLVARELESRLPRKAWTTRHCQNPARA